MVMFLAFGSQYDAFGGSIAVASLASALGGVILGHFIDIGHGARANIFRGMAMPRGKWFSESFRAERIPNYAAKTQTRSCRSIFRDMRSAASQWANRTRPPAG